MKFKFTFKESQWVAVFSAILLIELALLYKLIAGQTETNLTEMLVSICTVAVFFVLSLNVDSIKTLTFGKEGFKAELEVLQKKTSENDQAISDLILLSMGDGAYNNLKKLVTENYGPYEKKHYMGLETELYHLRNLGYISLKDENAQSIFDIPESGNQLSDYIEVTDRGQEYLELREKYTLKG